MRISLQEVRRRYPDPMPMPPDGGEDDDVRCYCVGGALCLFLGQDKPFPDHDQLAQVLREANPALGVDDAIDAAERIIHSNDSGDLEGALEDREMTTRVQGYCMTCRTKRAIKDPQVVTLSNGRAAARGACADCGKGVYAIVKPVLILTPRRDEGEA